MKTFVVLCFIICLYVTVWCDSDSSEERYRRRPKSCRRCKKCCDKQPMPKCDPCSEIETGFQTISEKLDEILVKVANCSVPGPACSKHPVINPSFEEGIFGWSAPFSEIERVDDPLDGDFALLACTQGATQSFTLESGVRNLIASVFVLYTRELSVLPTIECSFTDANGELHTGFNIISTPSSGWQRSVVEIQSNEDLISGSCTLTDRCTSRSSFDLFELFTVGKSQDFSACKEMFGIE